MLDMKGIYISLALSLLVAIGALRSLVPSTHRATCLGKGLKLRMTTSSGSDSDKVIDDLLRRRDFATVFKYFKRNPIAVPTKDQAVEILNCLSNASIADTQSLDDFFFRLAKQGSLLTSFGCMFDDGPMMEQELRRFEQEYFGDPESLLSVPASVYSLQIPSAGALGSPSMRSEQRRNNDLTTAGVVLASITAQLLSLVTHNPSLTAQSLLQSDLTPLFSTLLALGGLVSVDNTIGQGCITRQMQWLRAIAVDFFDAKAAETSSRAGAATFIVAYLMGAPIRSLRWRPSEADTQRRFVFADAPRIEMTDPLIRGLQGRGSKITMRGLKRTATIQMASHALQSMEGNDAAMTEYQKMLFADLAHYASNIMSSDIPDNEFPQRLLPTLSAFGFLQSIKILQEVGDALIDAVAQVIRTGGNIGDACKVLEANFDTGNSCSWDSPVSTRKRRRLQEEVRVDGAVEASSQISVIMEAKALQATLADATLAVPEEVELIAGTDRALSAEEALLGPNPWAQEVAQLARELMQMQMQRDLGLYGRMQPRTQEEVKAMAARLAPALASKRAQEAAASPPGRKVSSHAEAVEALKEAMTAAGVHDDTVPSVLADMEILDQLIMDTLHVKKMHVEPISQMAASASQQVSALHSYLSGDLKTSHLVRAWDSEQLRTGITPEQQRMRQEEGESKSRSVTKNQMRKFELMLREARRQQSSTGGTAFATATAAATATASHSAVRAGSLLYPRGAAYDAVELKAQLGAERLAKIYQLLGEKH